MRLTTRARRAGSSVNSAKRWSCAEPPEPPSPPKLPKPLMEMPRRESAMATTRWTCPCPRARSASPGSCPWGRCSRSCVPPCCPTPRAPPAAPGRPANWRAWRRTGCPAQTPPSGGGWRTPAPMSRSRSRRCGSARRRSARSWNARCGRCWNSRPRRIRWRWARRFTVSSRRWKTASLWRMRRSRWSAHCRSSSMSRSGASGPWSGSGPTPLVRGRRGPPDRRPSAPKSTCACPWATTPSSPGHRPA